jgi:acyl-CoA synthetase (NDP forming)
MTSQPTAGEIVAITTTDSDPFLLVCTADATQVTGVLLADLSTETIHRLRASEPDTATRRQVATAVERADECLSFTVPLTDYARVERNSSSPEPFVGGEQ